MGTDIHPTLEVRLDPSSFWKKLDVEVSISDYRERRTFTAELLGGRNYSVFAMLADVRNGSGFAGVDTGDGFEPILPFLYGRGTPPARGLPTADDGYSTLEDEEVEHTPSWITLAELMRLEGLGYWDRRTVHRGVVTRGGDSFQANHDDLLARGEVRDGVLWLPESPESWCGDVSPWDPDRHVRCAWERTYRQEGQAILDFVTAVQSLIESNYALQSAFKGDPDGLPRQYWTFAPRLEHHRQLGDRVRLVFHFDS